MMTPGEVDSGYVRRVLAGVILIVVTLSGCLAEVATEPLKATPLAAPEFVGLPYAAELPSGESCARKVEQAGLNREVRPENEAANHSVPQNLSLPPWPDFWDPSVNRVFVPRIDGAYTGTTDQVIAWAACKWGFDADLVRAMAVTESSWRQSFAGDVVDDPALCVGNYSLPCPTSFGLLQLKHITRPGSWPYSHLHTAFNVDYSLAVLRGCFEGWVTYLGNGYGPGDLWG